MAALWLLNLDADLEFAALREGLAYSPPAGLGELVERVRRQGLGLVRPGDFVLAPGSRIQSGRLDLAIAGGADGSGQAVTNPSELVGRAFCPTPSAQRLLAAAGVRSEVWPDLGVVQEVNGRSFAASVGLAPRRARLWSDGAELSAWLRGAEPGRDWLAKREHGVAGKGQRPLRSGQLEAADAAWIAASLRGGPLLVEPRRSLCGEFAQHGWLTTDGRLVRGKPVAVRVHGRAFTGASLISDELESRETVALGWALDKAAEALQRAGYFGPFGLDAYRWEDAGGALSFEPCSELNARYTLAWDLGMAASLDLVEGFRQDLDQA